MEHEPQDEILHCPLCGAGSFNPALDIPDFHLSNELFHLTDCALCGFRFTNPRPNNSTIQRYYASESYLSHQSGSPTFMSRVYGALRRIAFSAKISVIRKYVNGGKLLDIGCGTGDFLAFAASCGFKPTGVEPNISARTTAIERNAVNVVARVEDAAPTLPYRVITLWHVLEHLDNLHHSITQIHSLLDSRGSLFIAVPNRDSWDAAFYGRFWAAWDVPRHFSHFRTQDVVQLLEAHNFQVVGIRRMWLDAYFIALLSERYRKRAQLLSWIFAFVFGMVSNSVSLLSGRPTSSSLFIAKPK